ncbi:MAG TPA: glycosyltransferase family 39 protein [Steroidobacteraceae bacterium]|jgi:4-amino-4-deoxy-L-arabinose transferase-like glycosyltransferase
MLREADADTEVVTDGVAHGVPVARHVLKLSTLAVLLPLWLFGIVGRSDWKPDEPREADLAWHMSLTGPQAVPLLRDQPFVEKPPLTYWLAGATIARLGMSPWAARLPNLLYALVFATSLALLAKTVASRSAIVVAVAVGSSFFLTYQVAIWLATDAALLACVAASLLGLHLGYRAVTSRRRLIGYSLMHLTLALGFLAKSGAAWLVPATAFAVLIVWEKRYRELLRWELYVGLVLQTAIVAPWLLSLAARPDGADLLQNALWFNIAGRMVRLSGHAASIPQYADSHRNSFGKYFIEAPFYIMPWVFLAVAATRRGWQALRDSTTHAGAWRFTIAATLPSVLVLSLAATARGIYAAPSLIGVALAIALWYEKAAVTPDAFDLRMLRASSFVVVGIAAVLLLLLPLVAVFYAHTRGNRTGLVLGAMLMCGATLWLLRSIRNALRGRDVTQALGVLFASYSAILIGVGAAYFPAINREQDLRPVTRALHADLHGRALVLLAPDETTVAVVDMAGISVRQFAWQASSVDGVTASLRSDECVLAMTKLTMGPLYDLARRHGFKSRPPPDSVDIAWFASTFGLHIEHEYIVPDGRHYLLLSHTEAIR